MRVNNTEIKMYRLDIQNTIRDRISSSLNTLPKYLICDTKEFKSSSDVKCDDLLREIKNDAKVNTNFSEFLQSIQPKIENSSLDVKKDILNVWLSYNQPISELIKKREKEQITEIASPLIEH